MGLKKFLNKFGRIDHFLVPEPMSPLHVQSEVCMAPFPVWSKVCIALHMDGSHAEWQTLLRTWCGHIVSGTNKFLKLQFLLIFNKKIPNHLCNPF